MAVTNEFKTINKNNELTQQLNVGIKECRSDFEEGVSKPSKE